MRSSTKDIHLIKEIDPRHGTKIRYESFGTFQSFIAPIPISLPTADRPLSCHKRVDKYKCRSAFLNSALIDFCPLKA